MENGEWKMADGRILHVRPMTWVTVLTQRRGDAEAQADGQIHQQKATKETKKCGMKFSNSPQRHGGTKRYPISHNRRQPRKRRNAQSEKLKGKRENEVPP